VLAERTVATDGDSRITCVLFSGAPRWRGVCLRNQKAKNTFHVSITFQEIKNRTRFRPAISDKMNQGNISLSSTRLTPEGVRGLTRFLYLQELIPLTQLFLH